MKSIRAKLTVTILVSFCVSMSILGGLNYWRARDIITQNVKIDIQKEAENSAREIGEWLGTRKAEVVVLSQTPVMRSGNVADIVPYLVAFRKGNESFSGFSYVDPLGNLTASNGLKSNSADRDYFKRAMKGEIVITDPMLARGTTDQVIAVIAVPVKEGDKVIGVLVGNISVNTITNRVAGIKLGQTGYALVAQADGLTIFHPDKEVAMKDNPLTDPKADAGRRAITTKMVSGETGITTQTTLGVERYCAYAPIPNVTWSLAVTVPVAEVTGAVSSLTWISAITTLVVLVLAAVFAAWYTRRLVQPIGAMVAFSEKIASGDLRDNNQTYHSQDEFGQLAQALVRMRGNLHSLILKINGATDQVAASSEELTASSEQAAQATSQAATSIASVASDADQQLAAANDAAAVVEQMSASIQQIAANSNHVAEQSAQAAGKAKEGNQAVETAVTQMNQIKDTVASSAEVVAKLGERSKEIGQIVDTISGIAGQTNLLALNAAIEAARAGEQGRGFAVVAEEVRKLAEQSQEAAKQIAELITEIQADTDKAVVAMNGGTREVKTGAEVVNAAGAVFSEIAGLVDEVSGQVKDISAAIQQMASGSQQIVGAVKKIDELGKKSAGETQGVSAAAQEQLASMEEIAASSQALAKLAQDLQSAVATFRV